MSTCKRCSGILVTKAIGRHRKYCEWCLPIVKAEQAHVRHIKNKKPKTCLSCGASFTQVGRTKYCDTCRQVVCVKCHRPKELDGYNTCAECRQAARKWGKNNPEYFQKRDDTRRTNRRAQGLCTKCGNPRELEQYATCEACRERSKVWNATYELKNPGYAAANTRRWLRLHKGEPGRCTQCGRLVEDRAYAQCQACRASRKARRQNRRAAANGNGGRHTAADERDLFNAQDFKCFYCNQPLFKTLNPNTRHIEHIVAISNGGSNSAFNIVRSCDSCNNDKVSKYNDDASTLLDALTDKGTITDAELKKSLIGLSAALNENLILRVWRAE